MTPDLKLHNTLAREKQVFTPIDETDVRMYVCGPTVYDFAHIGNARPVVVFDVLARLLRELYGKDHVTYARNITDVDDKINARAAESGRSIRDITEETAAQFHADMAALGAEPPDVEPRATEHIGQMIAMIETLIAKGFAYPQDGHVFFEVAQMPDYGQLSGRDLDQMRTAVRDDLSGFDLKRAPGDFVLWKPSEDETTPGWDSPWGRGRPGWHIECSAMSAEHLCKGRDDKIFDIHGGGADLIFPHHENEIAQSRCAHGSGSMANYWMHNGYLMSEGEKMSKSLGNFYTVNALLQEFPGEAIRLVLLKTHYRQPLDFTKAGIAEAKRELDGFYQALRSTSSYGEKRPEDAEERMSNFIEKSLCDDLNSPLAISALHGRSNQLNIVHSHQITTNVSSDHVQRERWLLLKMGSVLGLLQQDPEEWFKWQPPASGSEGPSDAEIDALIEERQQARKDKNFARADEIRDDLTAAGIVLEDGAGGTSWKRA